MGVWCDECSAESLLLSPTEAAAVLQIEVDEIFRQVQAGTAHVDVDREAGMRVCLKSLTQAL